MTNLEWIKTLDAKEMAPILSNSCKICIHYDERCTRAGDQTRMTCIEGTEKWLEQERKEQAEALKTCPFCGRNSILINMKQGYMIQCCHCGATTGIYTEEIDAVKAWNMRKEATNE